MKPRNYFIFWSALAVVVIVPQTIAAVAYYKLADILTEPIKVEIVRPSKLKLSL
tara:strand:+ start:299 stop:460 length:162 start_codon:yes stop_codon:yes gene_type:complete